MKLARALPIVVVLAPIATAIAAPSVLTKSPMQAASSASIAPTASAPPPVGSASSSSGKILDDPGKPVLAYENALAAAKLAGPAFAGSTPTPYTPEEVAQIVADNQVAEADGRSADVIASLTGVVESQRFSLVEREPEGRAAKLLLGEAYQAEGVHALARVYLKEAASGPPNEATARIAARRLVEIALDDEEYAQGIDDLTPIVAASPNSNELRGELDYLVGREAEAKGDVDGAMTAYARIVPLSRFWSSATYRRGVLEVDRNHYPQAEALFCQVADPKRQDASAPVFADERFFAVRDLARLALGRLAHEERRNDDARYYYYLVPQDSKRLAEALYESATTRYEADDYDGARELLDELNTLGEGHPYDDEAHVLDAYVDIARCDFASAAKKLDAFLTNYRPLRDRVHLLAKGPDLGVRAFVDRQGSTGASDIDAKIWRRLEADPALLFVLRARRRLAIELGALDTATDQLKAVNESLSGGATKPAVDLAALGPSKQEKIAEAREAVEAIRNELAILEKNGAPLAETKALHAKLDELTDQVDAMAAKVGAGNEDEKMSSAPGVPSLIVSDVSKAKVLKSRGEAILAELDDAAVKLARDALIRLDKRASRLVARARLAKIDVVLGEKKGLENEIEAIRSGILPKDAIDSLDAIRYLRDDEEYWPFEGDEWRDEVVGGEQK